MSTVAENKVFYNRVRRICMKHDIDIRFEGTHRVYLSVHFLKDNKL